MNKQQLAAKIWESANKMRSKIEANEYKDYILGFIFYKFLSDSETKYLKNTGWSDEDMKQFLTEEQTEIVDSTRKDIGYFISYENLFSTWITQGSDFSAENVTTALSAFSRLINASHKRVFDGVFKTLETGLSKLGETSGARTKAIRDLLYLIKDIPMDGKQDYDVLGFIYEYLISNFAANAGKKAGEFYTPQEVSLLMSEIVAHHLKDRAEIKIYDPTSGSGSLLINIGKCAARYIGNKDNIKYYAQELKENTYNLTRMNLVMRGILPDNILTRNGDTLEDDWPFFEEGHPETYDPLYVDSVVSNPPYSQAWNPDNKANDARYAGYGLAPKGKADYAFLLHDLYHLKTDGIMTIVLPHGVLFRGGEEGEIRKNLIEKNKIDAIIGLPANIFFGTGIPTIIMVLKQDRSNTDVLIVDASKGFEKVGKNNVLRACDIKKIVDTVISRSTIDGYSKEVDREEIRANEYNLNIPRYVDSSEKPESWDIYASMFGGIPITEIDELSGYWDAFPSLREAIFNSLNSGYCEPKVSSLKDAVQSHPSIVSFMNKYRNVFADFASFLDGELLKKLDELNISKEEDVLANSIFNRLSDIPLIDKYIAFQQLHDNWKQIAVDLEIIQTEGRNAITQVDPNMVVKKKNNKDEEVQEGWIGHILPFGLVQKHLLAEDLAALKKIENEIAEMTSTYSELLDEISEDYKDRPFISEDNFVPAEVKKAIKAKDVDAETLAVLKKVDIFIAKEKTLKKQLKESDAALHLQTKTVIEKLSDSEAIQMLYYKWITPLTESINKLPEIIVAEFIAKLETLCNKYETTFAEVEQQIAETEQTLIGLLDELEGNEFDMQGLAELKKLLGGE